MGKGWNRSKKWMAAALALWLCLEPGGLFRTQTGDSTAYAQESSEFDLYSKSAVLMDGGSGRVLYAKDGETPLAMASTTKIMTCILALELADADMVCTASQNAASQPKVKLGMAEGEQFYLKDLLYSLMLESHNDTAVCIAEAVGGSVEGFAERMNQKASEIGCTQTHYVTPNGLDAEDSGGTHHTTARDLALVMRYCLTQSPRAQEFLEITRTASYSFTDLSGQSSYSCSNHNSLLTIYDGALSGKTGFTGEAGYCYVGAAGRGEKLLIVALLACGWPNNKGYKWVDAKKLLNYGFSEYELRDITQETDPAQSGMHILQVTDGQRKQVAAGIEAPAPVYVLMRAGETVQTEIELAEALDAPVEEGQQAGQISWLIDGTVYASVDIITRDSVPKRTFLSCLKEILKLYLREKRSLR